MVAASILAAYSNNSRYLYLIIIHISDLPKEIGLLDRLHSLVIVGRFTLNKLPQEFENLKRLEILMMTSVLKVNSPPLHLCGLKNLRALGVTSRSYNTQQIRLEDLPELRILFFFGFNYNHETKNIIPHLPKLECICIRNISDYDNQGQALITPEFIERRNEFLTGLINLPKLCCLIIDGFVVNTPPPGAQFYTVSAELISHINSNNVEKPLPNVAVQDMATYDKHELFFPIICWRFTTRPAQYIFTG